MTASTAPSPTSVPAVEVRKASLIYNPHQAPVHALADIDLTIAPGEFVSLIGPSGCGKTTLLRVIADLEHITSGTVQVTAYRRTKPGWRALMAMCFRRPPYLLGARCWAM